MSTSQIKQTLFAYSMSRGVFVVSILKRTGSLDALPPDYLISKGLHPVLVQLRLSGQYKHPIQVDEYGVTASLEFDILREVFFPWDALVEIVNNDSRHHWSIPIPLSSSEELPN